MKKVWAVISRCYSAHHVSTQFSGLTLNSFTNPDSPKENYPELKGNGAENKDLVGPLWEAWTTLMAAHSYGYERVNTLLETQLAMLNLLNDNSGNLFLTPADAHHFRKHTDDLLFLYTELAKQADREGLLLWKVVPKHHWLWHLAQSKLLESKAQLLHA